ncbi:MAG: hypothetical protein QXK88_10220 [Desulfurococcaceae archaeon]
MDDERLLEEVETIEVDSSGVEVRVLTREAEAVATVAHAIYEEYMYLLSDCYVTREWLNTKALGLARELKAGEAVETALRLNEQIERGLVEAPIKLAPIQSIEVLARKFVEDSSFRATTVNTLRLAMRKRTM